MDYVLQIIKQTILSLIGMDWNQLLIMDIIKSGPHENLHLKKSMATDVKRMQTHGILFTFLTQTYNSNKKEGEASTRNKPGNQNSWKKEEKPCLYSCQKQKSYSIY